MSAPEKAHPMHLGSHLARAFLAATVALRSSAEWCGGQPGNGDGGPCRVDGPANPSAQPEWLRDLQKDRSNLSVTNVLAQDPSLDWARTAWVQPQMHPFDRYFYDPVKHEFTVDRYLDDLSTRCNINACHDECVSESNPISLINPLLQVWWHRRARILAHVPRARCRRPESV